MLPRSSGAGDEGRSPRLTIAIAVLAIALALEPMLIPPKTITETTINTITKQITYTKTITQKLVQTITKTVTTKIVKKGIVLAEIDYDCKAFLLCVAQVIAVRRVWVCSTG